MKLIRVILGNLILFFNWLFTPRGIKRSAEAQKQIDTESQALTLYGYKACPFCVKVKREMKRLSLNIEFKDPKRSETSRDELINGGGQLKVPCLKIKGADNSEQWMYESSDIINFLQQRFS